ncbi:MFS transporter [Lihuaxuella thermophila]|uniref:Drug resistance transporter, EmrB/QacA subfamily n=1 Tax=Lihuaxuella thermophila TaxID=1173111 RepID=A0A1H8BMM8_9BACL|nr:MFS transporter [Lihuaxuella thermophila]SEM84036.1 drug resistance transporter, EmrB/QacA subfamily [Lihuaxuella thermophila]
MKMSKRSIIFTGILLGAAANMMMQTVVATILPQAARELGDSHLYGWVFSGYLLMSTITIPLFAKLADLYGYKLFFTLGMSVFLIGSFLCGLAPSLSFLVMARLIQGVGAGALGPVTVALIGTLFPIESRGKALSAFAAIQLFSNLLGPVAGGIVSASYGWSSGFYMVIPLGLLSLITIQFAQMHREQTEPTSLKNMDYWGALLLGAAIALFIQTWTVYEKSGWNWNTTTLLVASILLFIWFMFQENKHPDPVLSPGLIRIRNVSLANLSALFVGILMYGAIAVFPLYATVIFEGSSSQSTPFLLPLMLGLSTGILFSGRMIQKISYKMLARTGWLTSATGLFGTSISSFMVLPVFSIYIFAFIIGFGVGTIMPTFLLPAQNAVSEKYQATVGGMVQLSRNIGGAIGIPVLTSILAITSGWGEKTFQYGLLFLVLFFLSLFGFLIGSQFEGAAVTGERKG